MKTLFERLGGTEGITSLVDEVVEAHMNNPAISARFLPYTEQPEKLATIKKHTIDFFVMGSGGPTKLFRQRHAHHTQRHEHQPC